MKTILLSAFIMILPMLAAQAQDAPATDIKCNGEDDNVIVFYGNDATLTIDIDANDFNCDIEIWVLAKDSEDNKRSFSSYDRKWHKGWCTVYYTGPLSDITDTVLDHTLPLGSYTSHVAIDSSPNGQVNIPDLIVHDTVHFQVIPEPPAYKYDDGTAENALGLASPGEFCWMHRFEANFGAETIVNVQVAFGTPLAPGHVINGAPCTVYVWDDPDDDGDPSNAVLLHSESGTIQDADTDTFNVYTLSTPVTASGVFFVGCMTATTPTADTPAGFDTDTPYVTGNGWYAFVIGGSFDPNDLSSNSLYENAAGFSPYYYLLRAGFEE